MYNAAYEKQNTCCVCAIKKKVKQDLTGRLMNFGGERRGTEYRLSEDCECDQPPAGARAHDMPARGECTHDRRVFVGGDGDRSVLRMTGVR